ncbi:N utilization substance protein B [Elusimicrobium simillimum]|uniref:transcription antitermination factor NusB n=1 Tax=Elusimicrobium simillimum TaxID=3143438 RepID=UPI003C6FCC16
MGKRRLAREYALQTLYFVDTGKINNDGVSSYKEDFREALDADSYSFCVSIIDGTLKNIEDLDKIITKYAKNWSLARMSVVDRSILRLAAYELTVSEERTPVAAVIDEAIELAKKFSTENSSRFINGLLDQIKKERKNGQN